MRASFVLFVVLLACSDDSSETPAAASAAAREATSDIQTDEESDESEDREQDLTFEQRVESKARRERRVAMEKTRRDRDEAASHAREDAVVVRRARMVARRGAWDEAYALLQPLLERSPNGRRLHCEAGYYAHKSGEYRAASLIDRGLRLHGPPEEVSETMRVPLAMCLYNRGLVYADANQRERAASMYRASLALRSNATVERTLRDLGEIRVVDFERPTRRPEWPSHESGLDLTAMLERMAPIVCGVSSRLYNRDDELACQIDRRRLAADGEGPRVDFVVFRPAARGEEPSMVGTYDDVGYVAIHADEGRKAAVFGPVSTPSVMHYDPEAAAPRVVSWVDLDLDGREELLVDQHESEASSEDGCSDSYYSRTMFIARRGSDDWESRAVTVGSSTSEMCFVRHYTDDGEEDGGEVESEESESGLPSADFDVPEGGGLRFRDGDVERRFTLAELFERCESGCRLSVAADVPDPD